jgi:nicotinate-nucleotide pyrophosphorylase (carboxylating)
MDHIERLIHLALTEDIGKGDITSCAVVPAGLKGRAEIRAKQDMIVCGLLVAEYVFKYVDFKIKFEPKRRDGAHVKKGTVIATAAGPVRSLLTAERTALNFLQRLSGTATLTHEFVSAVKGTKVKILDTRKTTPGHRLFEKYAVRIGGGMNHRTGLFDMFLIKNNHVDAAGSVTEAVLRAKHYRRHKNTPIEVEVRDFNELQEAVTTGADVIMLDNFSPKMAQKAVKMTRKLSKLVGNHPKIELSGGISLKNIKKYLKTGVDFISVGALTHSARAVDICMRMGECKNCNL